MKKSASLFFLLFFLTLQGLAQIPTLLNQQGFLSDTSGTPLNGTFSMTFNIYTDSTGGTLMLTQNFPSVTVTKGSYAVNINVSSVSFNKQLWMETQVGSSTLTPRIRLTSAPYSQNSLWLLGPSSEATGANSIAGGTNNRARGSFSVVGGGGGALAIDSNSATGSFATVAGGKGNIAAGSSFVGGGQNNKATGNSSTVAGGYLNTASGAQSAIGGGWTHTASGLQSTVAGGDGNTASGDKSSVLGGQDNDATGNSSVVVGGSFNHASGMASFVGGGYYNKARGNYSSVIGGGGGALVDSNSALGTYSTVAGGRGNTAKGNSSLAAGRYAKAEHDGSFVWNSSTSNFSSTDSLQFIVNAPNGVGIGTNSPDAELQVSTTSSVGSINNASIEIEAAGLNINADASLVFNIGTNTLMVPQTKWSLGLDDSEDSFSLSKDDTLGNNQLLKIEGDGSTTIYNSDEVSAFQIITEDGSTGAQLKLHEKTGNSSITIMAEDGYPDGGALIKMYDGETHKTVEIDAKYDSLGGRIALAENDADQTLILTAQEGPNSGGAQIELRREDGTTTFILDAQEGTQGAVLEMYNSSGTKTIDIDADYNGSGESRVTTQVLEITGGSDLAEPFEITGGEYIEAGMVVSIDEDHPGQLTLSSHAYDSKVAGVISGANGVKPGITLNQKDVFVNGRNVAMSGRVYCYVDATQAPVTPGDLLTTSDIPGYAMKATDKEQSHGTVIGKAMSSLKEGKGLVLVLVNLQ